MYIIVEKKDIFSKKFIIKQTIFLLITLSVITLWKPEISDKYEYDDLVSSHIANNKVLVVGDSWSKYLGIGLEETSKKRDYAVYNYGVGGFGILDPEFYVYSGGENLESTEYNEVFLDKWLKTVESFDADVVLITLGNFDQAAQIINGETIRVGNETFDTLYKTKFKEIIDKFLEMDVKVVVTNVVDNARADMSASDSEALNNISDSMAVNLDTVMKDYKNNKDVVYFDLDKILSPNKIAPILAPDGTKVYDETNHPSEETCTYIGSLLFDEFDKILK